MEKIYFKYDSLPKKEETLSLSLGNFDGFHLGHYALSLRAFEDSIGLNAILLFSSSYHYLSGKKEILTTLEEKLLLAKKYRYERAYILQTDLSFYSKTHEEFERMLFDLGAKRLFLGEDFRYGKDGTGDAESLRKAGFEVCLAPFCEVQGRKISSRDIRQAIKEGSIEKANSLLGRPYQITGKVEHGKKNGTKIGFPTANLSLSATYVIPALGVYIGEAFVRGIPHKAMISIGHNPTFGKDNAMTIEAHLLDFDGDIYDETLHLSFLSYLRPVASFPSIEELVKQLKKDEEDTRSAFLAYLAR